MDPAYLKEIDLKEAEYIASVNAALSAMRDQGGRWWLYGVGHRHFEMVVGDPDGQDNLVLCLTACSYITGPVIWKNQYLKVIWKCIPTADGRDWEFALLDETVGFKVEARTFQWARNFDLLKYGNLYNPQEKK